MESLDYINKRNKCGDPEKKYLKGGAKKMITFEKFSDNTCFKVILIVDGNNSKYESVTRVSLEDYENIQDVRAK